MKRNASNTYSIIEITMSNIISGYHCLTSELEETIKFWNADENVLKVEVVATAATKKEAGNIAYNLLRKAN